MVESTQGSARNRWNASTGRWNPCKGDRQPANRDKIGLLPVEKKEDIPRASGFALESRSVIHGGKIVRSNGSSTKRTFLVGDESRTLSFRGEMPLLCRRFS